MLLGRSRTFVVLVALLLLPEVTRGDERVLDSGWHHLRSSTEREWDDFPEQAESDHLELKFDARPNEREQSLRLRHRDLKQNWKVSLNGRDLGALPVDENEMVTFYAVPPQLLREGENVLRVATGSKVSDDVRVGDVRLIDQPRMEALSTSTLEVVVVDQETQTPLPCRITLVDTHGSLMTIAAGSDKQHAIRPGIVYTSNGRLHTGLPAGKYTVYAGRGFEYGIDSAAVEATPGQIATVRLAIRREVPTAGYVCCDTHCHTVTHSGHGDATLTERMVTLAGEGIELPVATDHNIHIDYDGAAKDAGVRQFFTPIVGNEVTTPKLGHFNVFPVAAGAPAIDRSGDDWETIFRHISETPGVQMIVLNHARDLHGGFRPFDPKRHIAPAGENIDGWKLQANAMELVNSGASQTDQFQLAHDWFGLLNRGLKITPVGSSDSHDVARHFVGQGRTYVRCDDRDAGQIDVAAACRSLREGHVSVSFGLLAELEVEGRFGPGDLAAVEGELDVKVRVLGPAWTQARHVSLYMNGVPVREAEIAPGSAADRKAGVHWEGTWTLPRPTHDVYLAVIASGPGETGLFWPIPKAYQPTSKHWVPRVLSVTGAVFVDADRSGDFTSAFGYASRMVKKSRGEIRSLLQSLADYDEAVAIQAASLLRVQGENLTSETTTAALREAAPAVRRGFDRYLERWKQSLAARAVP